MRSLDLEPPLLLSIDDPPEVIAATILHRGARAAGKAAQPEPDPMLLGAEHKRRSQDWMNALHHLFAQVYREPFEVRSHTSKRAEFPQLPPSSPLYVLNKKARRTPKGLLIGEFLVDLSVIERGDAVKRPHSDGTPIRPIRSVVWQVESELAASPDEAAYDLDKLVAGAATNALFVANRCHDNELGHQFLLKLAAGREGLLLVAFLDHPAVWRPGRAAELAVYVRQRAGDEWKLEPLPAASNPRPGPTPGATG